MGTVPKELNDIIEKIKKNEVLEENRHKEVSDILSETSRLREENARLSDLLLEKDMEKDELRVNLAVKKEAEKFQEIEKTLVVEARLKWIKMNDDYEAQLDRESHERWEQRRSYITSLHADIEKIKSEEVDTTEMERLKQLLAGTVNKALEKTVQIEEEFIDFDMMEQLDSLETCKLDVTSNSYNFSTQKENKEFPTPPKSKFETSPRHFNPKNITPKSCPSNPRTCNPRLNYGSSVLQNKSNIGPLKNQPSQLSVQKPKIANFNKLVSSQQSKVHSSFDCDDDDFEYMEDFSPNEVQKAKFNTREPHHQSTQFSSSKQHIPVTQKSNPPQKSQFVPIKNQNYNDKSNSYVNQSHNSQFIPLKNQIYAEKSNSYSNTSQKPTQFTPRRLTWGENTYFNSTPKSDFAPKKSQNSNQKSNFEYNDYESSKDEISEPNFQTDAPKSLQSIQKPRYEFISAKTHYGSQISDYQSKSTVNQYNAGKNSYHKSNVQNFETKAQREYPKKSQFTPKNPPTNYNNFAPIRKEVATKNCVGATSLKTPVASFNSGFHFKTASTAAAISQPAARFNSAANNTGVGWSHDNSFADTEVAAASSHHQAAQEYENFNHSSHSPFCQTSQQEVSSADLTPKKSKFTPKKSQFKSNN